MCLRPASADTGIVFHRTDLKAVAMPADDNPQHVDVEIPARWDTVSDTVMSTTIQNDAGIKVATIEQLMAALAG